MKFQKTINSLEETSDKKNLLKNESNFMINKKKNYHNIKENWINKPFLLSINMVLLYKE